MHSSLIGKIEKAKRYAQEPERVHLSNFKAAFHGEHDEYDVEFNDGQWHCSCAFFAGWGVCSHTMAVHRLLQRMMSPDAAPVPAAPAVPGVS